MSFLNDSPSGIFILHENSEWLPPFTSAFDRAGHTYQEWSLTDGSVNLDSEPPQGVFWSRVSASSPSRGHAHAKEYGRAIIAWLESYGRRVVNGSDVLEFEVSKVRQQLLLQKAGFRTPHTIAAFSRGDVLQAAQAIGFPLILKHNQGGKGIGVSRFTSFAELEAYVLSNDWQEPIDGVNLVQEYVVSAEPFITRLEFIGGKFHYAVRVDTSAGSFELCPADACDVPDNVRQTQGDGQTAGDGQATGSDDTAKTYATVDAGIDLAVPGLAPAACDDTPLQGLAGAACEAPSGVFALRTDITLDDPFVQRLEQFLNSHGIEVAGVEFIETREGEKVIYDINTNTNYNSAVEEEASQRAADRLVAFLADEYTKIHS